LVVKAHDTDTGATLWFSTSERTDASRVLRSMATLGATMAGKQYVRVQPLLPAGEGGGEEGAAGKEAAAPVKEEKEDEAGKKKRRKKGKR
jgi:hypothetical protein